MKENCGNKEDARIKYEKYTNEKSEFQELTSSLIFSKLKAFSVYELTLVLSIRRIYAR